VPTDPRFALLELLSIATGYQRSRALMVAAELGIADLLRAGPRSVEELAAATGTHAATLYRLLRALAAVGVFEESESGADAYVLRRILHDWMDEEAIAILESCRKAMGDQARLLVIESVVGPPNADPASKFFDLLMLVSAGGRERTEGEWRSLFERGGFRLEQVRPASPTSYVITGSPA
jgi:hypothetical protein